MASDFRSLRPTCRSGIIDVFSGTRPALQAGMSRFEDRTTNWFTEGESAENLMATDVLEPQPRKPLWPIILGGVAGATALAACAFALVGQKTVVATREAPVAAAPSAPPVPQIAAAEPVIAAAQPVVAPAEPVVESASESASAEAAAESPRSEDRLAKVLRSRAHGKGRLAPKPTRAPMAQPNAGDKLLANGQNAAALAAYQRAIKSNPKDIHALKGACTALGHQGRVNDAARVCRRALSLQPSDVETHVQLATLYYSGGAYKWSANEWKRVLSLRPGDATARRGLKQAQARL
jgi:tetratricopeptide (TPR) repeat protein